MTSLAIAASLIGLQLAPLPTTVVKPIQIPDVAGKSQMLPLRAKVSVLVFVTPDCPIANRMAPELSRIVAKYQKKGVSFALVYVDPTVNAARVKQHLTEFSLKVPGVIDSKHRLVKLAGATVTPQAVVFSAKGNMVYRGRINDLFEEHGKAQNAPKVHDLRNALDQVLAGVPVKVPQTPALGCDIPSLT